MNGAVGLFVSGVNNQLARYVAWKPGPGAWKTDAFSVNWTFFFFFWALFPCFLPYRKSLAKN